MNEKSGDKDYWENIRWQGPQLQVFSALDFLAGELQLAQGTNAESYFPKLGKPSEHQGSKVDPPTPEYLTQSTKQKD